MNTKLLFATAALFAATATTAFAQTGLEDDKTKTTVDGMKTKTKTAKDGKMKVKGKDDAGNEMKAVTKPYKGKMAKRMNGEMSGDMKMKDHKGMKHHKGMKGDSTKMGGM
jgi:hypothetical protein